MSLLRLIVASLAYHWRMNCAVACGVAAGTAVLTGALLVGDSMRGSLRRLTLDRLGQVEEALVADRFFRTEVAEQLAAQATFQSAGATAVPVILLRGSLENAGAATRARANRVNVIGCDEPFWRLGGGGPSRLPGRGEVVLNRPLADELGVRVGQAVVLRLPRAGTIPAESLLGERRDTLGSVRLTVCEILAAEGFGRFGLRPDQQVPRNAYLSRDALAQTLGQSGRDNAILTTAAVGAWQPNPEDCGISLRQTPQGYVNITSERMLIEPAAEKAILQGLEKSAAVARGRIQPALTYLANTIACGGREIPYSTITAIDFAAEPPLGPMLAADGRVVPALKDDQIALNAWAAAELHARPGDAIRVSYFEPESVHGRVRETAIQLRLAAVVRLAGAAADRALTPAVRGITDTVSMAAWNAPFPFDARRVRPIDDQYWREHGPTPKAFVSLALGRRLWSSRFGQTTSIRVAPPAGLADLRRKLRIDPAALGLVFQPVRQQGLAASAGSTPFDVLFLAFSSFIIAAAVILVGLLFRLGVERRATEAGILLAIGMAPRRLGRLLAAEGLLLATIGSLVGVAGAIVYAAILLLGLRTWWLAAVNTPRLRLYVTPQSLLLGYAVGLVVAFAVIAWSVRRMAGIPPRRLLAGSIAAAEMSRPENTSPKRKRGSQIRALLPIPPSLALRASVVLDLAAALLILAPAVVLMNLQLGDEAQAGAFFAVGALALTVLMSLAWIHLRAGRTGAAVAPGRGNLLRLAVRNAARNPGRSALSMGLIAAACFVIVAVAAFHAEPPQGSPLLAGGSGGFALVAECDQPVYQDLNTHEGRMQLGFSDADDRLLAGCTIFALRAKAGDDASCRNLYQPRQPRLLGVTPRLIARGGFAWVGASAALPNPWRLLDETAGAGQDVPMILDGTTATYALHLEGPDAVYEIDDSQGRKVRLRVAALLADSIFQGDLLVSETALLRIDPQLGGYRFFLIEAPAEKLPQVRGALEETLGDYGFAAETTGQRLAAFMAVENTYLAAFQSLGGLGLLLGTIGLGAVQLRNVLERRGELALLRAAGFRRRALVELVLLENMLLLLAGLIAGILAALVAILPHLVGRAATIPWHSLAATLLLVLAVGLLASLAAVRTVLSAPLWKALGEQR